MNPTYAVILVDSTSHALRIEKVLVGRGLTCKLIPVPRHLSSDCGVCVRIRQQDMTTIYTLLTEQKIIFQSVEMI